MPENQIEFTPRARYDPSIITNSKEFALKYCSIGSLPAQICAGIAGFTSNQESLEIMAVITIPLTAAAILYSHLKLRRMRSRLEQPETIQPNLYLVN